jgi:hypothetical protein
MTEKNINTVNKGWKGWFRFILHIHIGINISEKYIYSIIQYMNPKFATENAIINFLLFQLVSLILISL